jgi:hypothetical protein
MVIFGKYKASVLHRLWKKQRNKKTKEKNEMCIPTFRIHLRQDTYLKPRIQSLSPINHCYMEDRISGFK